MESLRNNKVKYEKTTSVLNVIDNLEDNLIKNEKNNTKKINELEEYYKEVMKNYTEIINNLSNK